MRKCRTSGGGSNGPLTSPGDGEENRQTAPVAAATALATTGPSMLLHGTMVMTGPAPPGQTITRARV